ncbi:MAG: DUF1820 family protein [Pseudomonadales bacterium]|nr:DUF1820 family protein [Pseudomonadales bacterium]NRA14994.1 DUF1820 family protein [Oceanospirillaceae bacterium]
MAADDAVYRVSFINQDKVVEVFVKHVYQSDIWGFIQLEGFIFGQRSELLVDPGEEKVKQLFNEVKSSFIPTQAILRIDEVERSGVAKLTEVKGSVSQFPFSPPPRKL